jgi:1-deoxy-D-xylulose-5-phosphate synthase
MAAHGITPTLADARFAKPLDRDLTRKLLRTHRALIIVEQGTRGSFGAMVLHDLASDGLLDGPCQVRTMTLPARYIGQAAPDAMYAEAGLTAVDIAATALQVASIEMQKTKALG